MTEASTKISHKRKPLKFYHLVFLLILIIGTIYVANSENSDYKKGPSTSWQTDKIKKCTGNIFGTIYNITYESKTDLSDSIKKVLCDVDNSLSPFNKNSNITAINNNTTNIPDARMAEVFMLAKEVSHKTNGAFDITVAPLVNLWGFGFEKYDDVDTTDIDSIREFIGFNKICIENNQIKKADKRIKLDCSAIAKGYGVDAVGVYLEKTNVKNYMVEIGGEIRARGLNPDGNTWRIGLTNPTDDILGEQEIEKILNLTDISVATSGNYRNYYIKDGKKYAHTIDPRTGYPVQHNILSSTVIAKDCATADAYATAFMVVGLDSAISILNNTPEIQAIFIYDNHKGSHGIWHSPTISDILTTP